MKLKNLPPETISIKRSLKRSADDAHIHDEPDVFRIENQVKGTGAAGQWIYVKKSRTSLHKAGSNVAPSFSSAKPNSPSSNLANTATAAATIRSLKQADQDLNESTATGSEPPPPEPLRYHLRRQPKSQARGFFTRPSRPKEPSVLFENRKTTGTQTLPRKDNLEKPLQESWTLPTRTTPAPPLIPHPKLRSLAPLRNVRQPSGQTMRWDASAEEMNEAMQKYTLESIGATLSAQTPQKKTEPKPPSPFLTRPTPPRFKPKTPVKRYHERHPSDETARSPSVVPPGELADESMADAEAEDEDAYVIDEFVRMPIDQLSMFDTNKTIGLLVLEEQEDIDVFYANDSDDEDEIYDEEEDENAENHHSTEYPDDDLDSDDEYNRNPYHFRNRNASDEEEFDHDDAMFSDGDDDDDTKGGNATGFDGVTGWSTRPPWLRSKLADAEEREAEAWN